MSFQRLITTFVFVSPDLAQISLHQSVYFNIQCTLISMTRSANQRGEVNSPSEITPNTIFLEGISYYAPPYPKVLPFERNSECYDVTDAQNRAGYKANGQVIIALRQQHSRLSRIVTSAQVSFQKRWKNFSKLMTSIPQSLPRSSLFRYLQLLRHRSSHSIMIKACF